MITPLVHSLFVAAVISAILYGSVAWAVFIVAVLVMLFLPTAATNDL